MKQFKKIAKLIQAEKSNEVAQRFVQDLSYTIEQENTSDYIPTRSYKPSGISGCKRSLYYQMIGAQPDDKPADINLLGICESGTDRHEIIQEYIQNMCKYNIPCEWIDVGVYLLENNISDPHVVSICGNETKLCSEKYNMRFMCDGLVCYRDEYYIIEIKTESSRKYGNHSEPYPEHKLQAACYAMNLKVNKVIFIYENRDNCSKKGYLFEVPQAMIEKVEGIINYVDECVSRKTIPPKELDKCDYCKYKGECCKNE